jgi:acetyl-CoA carboxylase carboxyl transferase subunit beta
LAATADLRLGIAGATVGFSGPRMVEAMTGATLPAGANTAESAVTAGLVDAVVPGPAALDWLARALAAFAPLPAPAVTTTAVVDLPPMPAAATGWQQVRAARRGQRPDGHVLIRSVLGDCVPLRGADDTVAAAVGHIASGQPAVAVAVAATRGGRPTPAGYALLTRSARLADRLRLPLVTLVDTPGADPSPASEAGGLAPRMAEAMAAMLACRTPTVAVVHGEGGSGGALAAAVADEVLVTEFGYFAALAPEGAAATLHLDAETAADRVGLGPADLVRLGFARPVAAAAAPQAVAAVIQRLQQIGGGRLTARRKERWAGRLRNP